MAVRITTWIGIILCVGVLLYAIGRILLGIGALYLFVTLFGQNTPPSSGPGSPSPAHQVPAATVLPAGYRGIALICSVQGSGPNDSVVVPESGAVCVVGVVPPAKWVFSDGATVSFNTPQSGDTTSVYATFVDDNAPGGRHVWMVCVGNRADHEQYEPRQKDVWAEFVARGCSVQYEPPHTLKK
jgi:hypothetical protein